MVPVCWRPFSALGGPRQPWSLAPHLQAARGTSGPVVLCLQPRFLGQPKSPLGFGQTCLGHWSESRWTVPLGVTWPRGWQLHRFPGLGTTRGLHPREVENTRLSRHSAYSPGCSDLATVPSGWNSRHSHKLSCKFKNVLWKTRTYYQIYIFPSSLFPKQQLGETHPPTQNPHKNIKICLIMNSNFFKNPYPKIIFIFNFSLFFQIHEHNVSYCNSEISQNSCQNLANKHETEASAAQK